MCTNEPAFLEVLYAAQRIGLRLTPINWHLTGEEAAYIIENCEAKAFVCSGTLGDAVGRRGRGRRPGPGQDQHGRLHPRLRDVQRRGGSGGRLRHRGPVLGTQMLYTSGTTGRPKGVHRDSAAVSALATVNFCGYDEDYETSVDAHLLTGPLYHAAPLAFSVAVPLVYGVPLVVMDHWDPVEALPPDRAARHHAHAHGPDHVPPPAGAARPRRGPFRHLVAPLRDPRRGAVPRPGQAAPDRVARARWWSSTTPPPRAWAPSSTPTTWLAHPGTVGRPMVPGLVKVADDARQRPPTGRGRPRLPAGAGRHEVRLLRRHGEDGRTPSAATTSRWATWATWTPRDSST